MCRRTATCFAALIALAFALPAVAEEAPSQPAPPAAAEAPAALEGGLCADVPGKVVDFQPAGESGLVTPDSQPMIGCTASYNCVHGTIVSCSSPLVGTCTSSGAGCGRVTCNGTTTKCPGYCVGDHHCANFCDWAPEAYCDWGGCCDCDG